MHWNHQSTNSAILEVRDLSVTYAGGVTALEQTSLQFRQGELTVLLGQSGAGKSTLLRCLNLLAKPTAGSVWSAKYGEVSKGRVLKKHRRELGMVFQQHQLIRRLTALENVLMGRLGYYPSWRTLLPLPRADRQLGLQCLERVGMLGKAMRRVSQMSGGEQQRVGIARALCQQPQVLLADEPVASLDPGTARRLLDLLTRICREDGIAVIVSLHQVELAREYADRVIGLRAGKVIFDEAPDAIGDELLHALYNGEPQPDVPSEEAKMALSHS